MIMTAERKTISTFEAADRLGVSDGTIRRYMEEERLEGYRMTPDLPRSPWRIYEDSVAAFDKRRKGDTGPLT